MLKNFFKKAYYRLCHSAEKLLYRHQTPIFRQNSDKLGRLAKSVKGLHSLLPRNPLYTYSLLIPVLKGCTPDYLKNCLEACLLQSASEFEVLVGVAHNAGTKFQTVIEEQKALSHRIKTIEISSPTHDCNATSWIYNCLAKEASGNFLILVAGEDWIRPDFTFRFEQVARLLKDPENHLFYCDEYTMDKEGKTVYFKEIRKDGVLHFPYYFYDKIRKGVMCSRVLWEKARGFRESAPNGWEIYDFTLQLQQLKAKFQHLPFFLYARRDKQEENGTLPVIELREYVRSLGLDWEIKGGFNQTTLRGIPKLSHVPQIHVIIPFKDQKILTLATVESLFRQTGVNIKITAVDNNSSDKSLAKELQDKGIEVLYSDEPFNYSRLNNFAVENTKIGIECEYILLLNNDVELDPGALLEMARWINQPHIGMVGCRLNYPNQTLQHGGVYLNRKGPGDKMIWDHIEKGQRWDRLFEGKQLQVVDAVTAACALIRRSTFLEVGGFDEVWYPIAFSDTNLAERLKLKGLLCFYTPYASGIHHESISRDKENIEDFESSKFLQELYKTTLSS